MGSRALLATLVLLALPAPAGAWVETATYDVPDDDVAACLRAASPGHISLLDLRSRPATKGLLAVGPAGLVPSPSITLGDRRRCGTIAGAGSAAPLLAAWRYDGRDGPEVLRVAEPGTQPVALRSARYPDLSEPIVALAPNAAAAVAWTENPLGGARPGHLFVAVRPSAGAPFARPSRLAGVTGSPADATVGIDDAGRATVAWIEYQRERRTSLIGGSTDARLLVATATPDGRFGPPQRLAHTWFGPVALSVLPDGRTLLATEAKNGSGMYERRSGDSEFAPVRLPEHGSMQDLAVALGPDGGAVIAYRNDERSVFASLRAPGGAFRRWQTVVPPGRSHDDSFGVHSSGGRGPDDFVGRRLRAAVGAGGEVALTWVDDADGRHMATAYAAHGTLAGGMERPERLSGPCRSAAAAAPFTLADGRLAVAWSDDAFVRRLTEDTLPLGGGRVHLAQAGTRGATPARAAPRLAAHVVNRALEPGQALRLRVRCDGGACDVRVLARARSLPRSGGDFGGGDQAIWLGATATLPAGGSAVVRLPRLWGFNAAGARDRPRTPVDVIACTPGGPMRDRVKLAPPRIVELPPLPRILDLRAVRRPGGAVRVTWRTSAPATRARFAVIMEPGFQGFHQRIPGRGRSSFAVTLPRPRRPVRRVLVGIESPAASFGRSASAPIT